MDEDIVVSAVEDVVVVEEVTDGKQEKAKTFTQEQMNRTVQERVNREKVIAKKAVDDISAERDGYLSTIEKYEGILAKQLEQSLLELPESYRNIVKRLPLLEQMELLANSENKISRKSAPTTPKPEVEAPKKQRSIGTII